MTAPQSGRDIREAFLNYFEKRDHRRVASSSLVTEGDPTLLFTNAGMVQFKRTFLGEEARDYKRACTSQKCMRVSGKHNDLENVGRTPRHHTFFEMLGNFSFGDYFKEEAVEMAWELVTDTLGIAPERLVASVFREDDEAFGIWRDRIGLPESKIYRLDEKENFWSMGDTGPCGPCSEIHVDFGAKGDHDTCDPSCDCGRWLEIWNLVFMQFSRDANGKMDPLPKPSIDTGAGLERLTCVLQGATSNYGTDLFIPILARAQELSGVSLGQEPEKDVSLQVVADHARACTFLIGDGVLPANEGRGYVLRRILRRAARHGVLLGLERPFLHQVADVVIDEMCGAYPEIAERRAFITGRIEREEERFLETLSKGLALLEEEIRQRQDKRDASLPGDVAFRLYDTFGFPLDLTEDILRDRGMGIDRAGFDASMEEQRTRARAAWKGSGDARVDVVYGELDAQLASEFRGYESLTETSTVDALLVDGARAKTASEGQPVEIVTAVTPFYPEGGGQVGDRGRATTESGEIEIESAQKPLGNLIVHRGRVVRGEVSEGETVELEVDARARAATVRNHSGTHLLHAALRKVLGPQAVQKGSLVAPDRLRFDFTHDSPLTRDEIAQIEDFSNEWIEENAAAEIRQLPYAEAIAAGAMAMFEEKYGDQVRVVSFGEASTELCGGTHAKAAGDIGFLKILSETGIAAGVRRIEALTGMGALAHVRQQEQALDDVAQKLKSAPSEIPERIEKLLEERRAQDREIEKLRAAARGAASGGLLDQVREIGGVRALAARAEGAQAKELRNLVDDLRAKLESGVVLLVAESEGRVSLALGVTPDLTKSHPAGELVREVAGIVGGKGGGRPDFAQAGGKDAAKIDAAIARFYELLEEKSS